MAALKSHFSKSFKFSPSASTELLLKPHNITYASANSLEEAVPEMVVPGSIVRTDDWSGYRGLVKHGYTHDVVRKGRRAVGRESKAHPAFCIIPSLDAERYHLPPIQGCKYRCERNGGLNKANPQLSSRDRDLPDCRGGNQRDAHSHPRRGWRVPKSVAAKRLALPSSGAALKVFPRMYCGMISVCPNAEGGMRCAFPPYGCLLIYQKYFTSRLISKCEVTALYTHL